MKSRNYICLLGLFAVISLSAKIVEFVEDAYLLQAPAEIVKIVQDLADEQHFDADYEVIIPKKAGMQINPWNRYISFGKNPKTGNVFIIINPEWFFKLTHDEQKYLITLIFCTAQTGSSLPLKMLPWIIGFISILSIILLTIGLGKYHETAHLKRWLRIIIALLMIALINIFLTSRLRLKIESYLIAQSNRQNQELVLEKSGLSKEVAIAALTKLDNAIKENLKNGETFFKPFEKNYEKQIEVLKNS